MTFADFSEVVVCDFEFHHNGFEEGPPVPVCCCAKELRSGREFRLWQDELARLRRPPYAHGPRDLFIAYHAPAELSCYHMLAWPMPRHVLDLCIEYRQHVNGKVSKHEKRRLLEALEHFGLPSIGAVEKENWQGIVLTSGPYSAEQRSGILSYCWSDIEATESLLKAMLAGGRCKCGRASHRMPQDLQQALFRGRYTLPVAATEVLGIPVDSDTWDRLLEDRTSIQQSVIAGIEAECPVYEDLSLRQERLSGWLDELGLLKKWPRTKRSSQLSTDEETFKKFSWHPQVERLRQVRQVVQQLRKPGFSVTAGRNYFGLKPFGAEASSRNATKSCLFQAPNWLRGLIQPKPGMGLVYADYSQEEFYVAGVLSGDKAMQAVYKNSDPYIRLAAGAGMIPPNGTKAEYPRERNTAKTALLAIQYGITAPALSLKTGVSLHCAEDLITTHKRDYRVYWAWTSRRIERARWVRYTRSVFGWELAVDGRTSDNTLLNFPVQSAGAEIMRLAHIYLWEAGIRVICPVHDAVLIECAEPDLKDVARETQRLMVHSSECVLGGHRLRVDTRILRHPDRLIDDRGLGMWTQIQTIQNRLSRAA